MNPYDIKFKSADLNRKVTVREYLKELLITLWDEGESFSGKRPFGNSGWQYDLYTALIKGGAITGTLDEDGYIASFDDKKAHTFVMDLIKGL